MLKVIIGLFGLIIYYAIAVGFVIRDSYFKHRFNLKASILWVVFVMMIPLLGFPLYILFCPNRNIKQNSVKPNNIFLQNKYLLLNIILGILFFITLEITLFLHVEIIPRFAEVFKDFNIELPVLTKILIGMSVFIRRYYWIAVRLVVIFSVLFSLICLICKSMLRKYAPNSYLMAIISYFILHGLLIGIVAIGIFLPIFKTSSIK
jgi:hypothetical protein